MRKLLVMSVLLACVSGMTLGQQMYRWVDANGEVHYTDNPALAQQAGAMTMDRPEAAAYHMTILSDEEADVRKSQESRKLEQIKQAQVNLRNLQSFCSKEYSYINSLKRSGRITTPDKTDKSGFRFLSNSEVKDYIAEKEAKYNQKCSGVTF